VLAAAVLPLVALIGLRPAWAAYACRVDRAIRTACCCPKTESKAPADDAARLAAACCCDITIAETSEPPRVREAQRAAGNDPPLLAIATIAFAPLAVPRAGPTPRTPVARPPPSRIPRFLANLTILR
jgi:hypothetical protein